MATDMTQGYSSAIKMSETKARQSHEDCLCSKISWQLNCQRTDFTSNPISNKAFLFIAAMIANKHSMALTQNTFTPEIIESFRGDSFLIHHLIMISEEERSAACASGGQFLNQLFRTGDIYSYLCLWVIKNKYLLFKTQKCNCTLLGTIKINSEKQLMETIWSKAAYWWWKSFSKMDLSHAMHFHLILKGICTKYKDTN